MTQAAVSSGQQTFHQQSRDGNLQDFLHSRVKLQRRLQTLLVPKDKVEMGKTSAQGLGLHAVSGWGWSGMRQGLPAGD